MSLPNIRGVYKKHSERLNSGGSQKRQDLSTVAELLYKTQNIPATTLTVSEKRINNTFKIKFAIVSRSEYGAFWKCIQAGLIYMVTQLAKMMVLATFFPDNVSDLGSDLIGEFLKSTVDLADLFGLYLVLSGIPGKGHSKVLTAGIGWATAEVILSRALLLWVGARGAEFDWIYIQKCLESNMLLIQHIVTATLVWLWSRHDLRQNIRSAVTVLLLLTSYKPLLLDLLISGIGANAWIGLLMKATVTLVYGLFTLVIYAGLAQVIGIF